MTAAAADGADGVRLLWRPGDVILDVYEVLEVVEGGAMGLVYRVRHRGWGVDLAVKAPRPELVASAAQRRDFEDEAAAWMRLGLHPHTVSCVYVRRLGGVPRVFAEWVDGGSLAEWVRDRRVYDGGPAAALERILDVAIQFARGLDHAHAQGLIHQDVKPANVMLTRDGLVKVTDFGLARAGAMAGENAPPDDDLRPRCAMTPAYCSPEQAERATGAAGQHVVALTRATDVWSWALAVLELFTGHPPCQYGQAGGEAFAAFIQRGQPDPEIPPMPAGLMSLLGQCLTADPGNRPATMSQIADVLIDVHERTFGAPYPRARPEAANLLADGLSNQALSMLDLSDVERAQALWQEAIQADGRHVHTLYNRGLHRWRSAQMTDQQLVAQLDAVRGSDAHDWMTSYLLGRVHLERGDHESALVALADAHGLAPADADLADAIALTVRHASPTTPVHLLPGHDGDGRIRSVDLSADGRLAITGCSDGVVGVWEVQSGRLLCTFSDHRDEVASVALSADGRLAVTGDAKGVVRVLDIQTSTCMRELQGCAEIRSLALSADARVVVCAAADDAVRMWELPTGRCIRTIDQDAGASAVAVSADGLLAISGDVDGTLRVWDVATGNLLRAIATDAGDIWCAAMSADGRVALSGGDDGVAKLWEVRSGRCLRTLKCQGRELWWVALSADGRLALTGSLGETARVWDLDTGRCLRTLGDHLMLAWGGVALSEDGRVALAGSDGRTALAWDLRPGSRAPWSYTRPREVGELAHEALAVRKGLARATRLIDEGELAAAISELRPLRSVPGYERNRELLDRWQQAGLGSPRGSLRGGWYLHDVPVDASVPAARTAAVDLAAAAILAHVTGCAEARFTLAAALSADGQLALTGCSDAKVRIYERRTGRLLRTLEASGQSVWSLAAGPDGRTASSVGRDGSVRVWELGSGRCLRAFDGMRRANPRADRSVDSIAVSSDGRVVLIGERADVRLWDAETGSMLHSLKGHGSACSLSLSADGSLGVVGGWDGALQVWDLRSARRVGTLQGHEGAVESVALSADDRFAVSGGHDRTVRVWELDTGRCLLTLKGHTGEVRSVALSADSRLVISLCADGALRAWELDWEYDVRSPADWDERARPHLERFLATQTMLRTGSSFAQEDLEGLLAMLERLGFGWLEPGGVRAELQRMVSDLAESRPQRSWLGRWRTRRTDRDEGRDLPPTDRSGPGRAV